MLPHQKTFNHSTWTPKYFVLEGATKILPLKTGFWTIYQRFSEEAFRAPKINCDSRALFSKIFSKIFLNIVFNTNFRRFAPKILPLSQIIMRQGSVLISQHWSLPTNLMFRRLPLYAGVATTDMWTTKWIMWRQMHRNFFLVLRTVLALLKNNVYFWKFLENFLMKM